MKLSRDPESSNPGNSYTVCMYRVSAKHRKLNEEAYTPRLVSIGPLHHGKSELQAMEAYKLSCLRSFCKRNGVSVEKLVSFAATQESYVRRCYEDTTSFSLEQFSEIILLDGIFVIELFLKTDSVQLREGNDALYVNRWMKKDVLHDMLLLENQLPIKFLRELFNFVNFERKSGQWFDYLAHDYFNEVGNTRELPLNTAPNYLTDARHFVEFLVYLHWPTKSDTSLESLREKKSEFTLREKLEYTRSASELKEAGVVFKCRQGSGLFDVSFSSGELIIPKLTVRDNTETFFRNSIAFEQYGYYGKNITSYVILMDSLINTENDVDLLVNSKIIEHSLGENAKVADLFNNLYKEVIANNEDFYFAAICEKLNTFSKDRWHTWKSTWFRWTQILMRDYFSNPWSFISLAAAALLLVLTIIQTVCSVISIKTNGTSGTPTSSGGTTH